MQYKVHGPFDVRRAESLDRIDRDQLKKNGPFWSTVEDRGGKGLSKAAGLYVFGLRVPGGKAIPYYVGKTNSRGGFSDEVFAARNLLSYNDIIHQVHGTPFVILMARPPARGVGWFLKPHVKELEVLEKILIGKALDQNEDLINVQHTKYLREANIPGALGKKRPGPYSEAEACLKEMLSS